MNYWVKTKATIGFKQLALSIVDNSTEIEEKSNYGVRILLRLKLRTTESTNSQLYWNSLSTLSESDMKNYQEYNSTTFPLTVKGSYYIESYKCETTLFMTGVALSWIVILVATLVILTRWKKVFEARDISLFLPFSVRMFLTNDPVNNPSQFEGMKISYKDLHFKDFSGTTHLNESSGEFLPYTLTALLGESGSGKTTFINTLSRRSGQGTMGGKVMIGGNSLNSESMKRLIGFVPQDDTMIPILTPKETLLFNSFVRNPDLTWSGHKERVDGILKDLKLIKKNSDVSNTIIGDEQKRGISGGEKKRVNVGIELVTQPPVLILVSVFVGTCNILAIGRTNNWFGLPHCEQVGENSSRYCKRRKDSYLCHSSACI